MKTNEITIKMSDETQNLPYSASKRDDGGEVFPYIDLAREPARVSDVPESAAHPAIPGLLAAINRPDGFFKSVRLDAGVDELAAGGWQFTCMVGLVARSPADAASPIPFYVLGANLQFSLLDHPTGDRAQLYLDVQRCWHKEEERRGWLGDISVGGSGLSQGDAEANASVRIEWLAQILPTYGREQ